MTMSQCTGVYIHRYIRTLFNNISMSIFLIVLYIHIQYYIISTYSTYIIIYTNMYIYIMYKHTYIYIYVYIYIPLSICTFLYISRHWNSKISHKKKVWHFDLWGGSGGNCNKPLVWNLLDVFFLFFLHIFLCWMIGSWKLWHSLRIIFYRIHLQNPFETCQFPFCVDAWNSGIWNWFVWYDCLLPLSCDLVVGCSSDHCHWHGTEHLRGHWRRSLQWPWDLETRPVPPEHGILESRHFFFWKPFQVGKKRTICWMGCFFFFQFFFQSFFNPLVLVQQKKCFIDLQIFIRFLWALALFFTGPEVGFEAPISLIAWKSLPPTLRQKVPWE